MTVFNAKSSPARRPLVLSTRSAGLVVGLLAGLSAAHAATPAAGAATPVAAPAAPVVAPAHSLDPAKQLPGAISVANIDFKRGEDGSGKLILKFTGDGAAPDLRNQGSSVIVDVGNAQLPAALARPLNVTDFATPVQRIDARASGNGTQLVLNTKGGFESLAYQTGREYIVEIVPKSAAAASGRAVGASSASSTSDASKRGYSGRPVTFNFQDVPVRTVLQLIAEESNLNVVAADTVQGNVTLRLVNVPWDQALDIVLQAKGLDKRRSGNVVWIAPQAEVAKYEQDKEDARIALDNRVDLVTEYIQINYHNAGAIFKALTEAKGVGGSGGGGGGGGGQSQNENGFLSQRGRLVADERTNTLMISDIPKKVQQMRELVRVIDRPVDQVVIEARIVIATESVSRELGAKFGISGSKDNAYFSGDLASNLATRNSEVAANLAYANAYRDWFNGGQVGTPPVRTVGAITRGLMSNLGVDNPAGSLALSILNAGYLLDIELSAIQEEGRGEVISNPRVVTSNQREAVISQGQEVGYVTISPQQGGNATPIPNVQFKDVLLELKVTPTITNDGRVFLNMAVKKDEVDGTLNTSIGQVPIIAKRSVNTAVLVEDGQTVVVGGVYEFRDRSDVTKVPFLGDIPFLGNLFKKKGRSKEKAELLIFVTPKVLKVTQR
ncbi:type IV pilus secretin PilQ family protein [Lysobacter sp. 5GHs7-4]|uniref:type IV pilus secretin PilQ n=1 Tax=Lysobacter sp. 5GHs7-4 TaxID=2904253 RepID=UPI001E56F046|nr:type IV pilus secretin PilQ family protein [Lysobacter sp. 5GHs7-4]UHQ22525.1 type IV pilus secretin PilQ family protein [Lysobacter sp. 5GHs7-4]